MARQGEGHCAAGKRDQDGHLLHKTGERYLDFCQVLPILPKRKVHFTPLVVSIFCVTPFNFISKYYNAEVSRRTLRFLYQAEDLIAATQKKDKKKEDDEQDYDADTVNSSGVDTDDEVSLAFLRMTAGSKKRRSRQGSDSTRSQGSNSVRSQGSNSAEGSDKETGSEGGEESEKEDDRQGEENNEKESEDVRDGENEAGDEKPPHAEE